MTPDEFRAAGHDLIEWIADYLERVRDHFTHCAWLNPMAEDSWDAPSIRLIRRIFPMYPLTVQGVEDLSRDLASNNIR